MAYYSVEPFGEERGDLRTGILASVIANVNRDRKKRSEPYTPQDFMPFAERPTPAAPPTGPVDPATLTTAFKAVYKKKGKR